MKKYIVNIEDVGALSEAAALQIQKFYSKEILSLLFI